LSQHWTKAQTLRRVFRPRVLIYSSILAAIVIAVLVSLSLRTPFKVDVVRDRGVMARVVAGGNIENVYRLQFMNATETVQQYKIAVSGLPGLVVSSEQVVTVESTQSRWFAVRLRAPFDAASPGSHPIHFEITTADGSGHLTETAAFFFPK
jgi:polyferredoxin